jgi:cell wall assembly regulator SMI1
VRTEDRSVVEASLSRLRELAQALPRPGCEWESRPTFDPPATDEAVAVLERAAGFPLPADLRAFFALTDRVNGLSVHNGYSIGGTELLAALVGSDGVPREVPDGLAAPVASDGGGNGFLVSQTGRVWGWDHETGQVRLVAESFAAFLKRVAEDWAAYVADTPGWRFLV